MSSQNSGLVIRGLLLLGMVVVLAGSVVYVVFGSNNAGPAVPAEISSHEPSADGWEVRYNATIALARRGSSKLPCAVLAEMLDEKQQFRNQIIKSPVGKEYVDEYNARKTVLGALSALAEWHKNDDAVKAVTKNNAAELASVYAAVDKLTTSSNTVLREEAANVKKTLGPR